MQRYPQEQQQQQHNPRERKYIHNPDTPFSQRDVPYSSSQYNPPSHQPQTNYNSRQHGHESMFQQPDHGNMTGYSGQMGRRDPSQSEFSSQQHSVGQYDGDPFDDVPGPYFNPFNFKPRQF